MVLPATAHVRSLDAPEPYLPLRGARDVETIEQTPLGARLGEWNMADRLRAGCLRQPGKIALRFIPDGNPDAVAQTMSYGELLGRACQAANLLRAMGVQRSDAIAVVTPTLPNTYVSLLAAFFAGIAFPVNWMLRPEALADLLRAAKVKAVIALGPAPGLGVWEAVQAACGALDRGIRTLSICAPGCAPLPGRDLTQLAERHRDTLDFSIERRQDEVAAYVHSGGTTGMPKIVRITHQGLAYRHWATDYTLAHAGDEVLLSDTPLFHVGGLCVRGLPPLASGMSVVIPSMMGARDKRFIAGYWKFIEKYRITRLSGVPTTLSVLLKHPPANEDLRSLKPCFATGSTALPAAVQKGIEAITGARALVMYGLTENTANVTLDPRDGAIKDGCSGIRVPYTQVRIARVRTNAQVERECAAGETGMVLVKGPGITPGYLDPCLDAGAFTPDGWFVSGDLGRLDEEGYLRITGREKDIIIRGGHNIDPGPIENALMQCSDVLYAAAVAKPDAHAGELPVAYVQLARGSRTSAPALLEIASRGIGEPAALPKEVVFLDEMPLSAVGKPLKALLRSDAARRAFSDALSAAGVIARVETNDVAGEGMQVEIVLPEAAATRRAAVSRQVDEVMKHYAARYKVRWESVDA